MAFRDDLPAYGLFALIGLTILYFAVIRPRQRDGAIERFLNEGVAAYDARDCDTAIERFQEARSRLKADPMPTREQALFSRCLAFTAPNSTRPLEVATWEICEGRPPTGGDETDGDPELFALRDAATASSVWGAQRIQGMIPTSMLADGVADFRYAVCQTVEQVRDLERCAYSRFANADRRSVIRQEQLWRLRLVDAISLETVDENRFWTGDPPRCGDTEEFYEHERNLVLIGRIDTARIVSWLEQAVP